MPSKSDFDSLLEFWNSRILTTPSLKTLSPNIEDTESIKDFLYQITLEDIYKFLSDFNFKVVKNEDDLQHLHKILVSIPPIDYGFYPKIIKQTLSATCAGSTLLANAVLAKSDIQFEYARAKGHSYNFVWLGDNLYILDGADAVFVKVGKDQFSDQVIDGVKLRSLSHDISRISHDLVMVLKPKGILVSVFGNYRGVLDSRAAKEDLEKNYPKLLGLWHAYLFKKELFISSNNTSFKNSIFRD
ncbi:hypothetical protein GW755_03895 [bacterium]|nr:hypothetical protein [bacterium]